MVTLFPFTPAPTSPSCAAAVVLRSTYSRSGHLENISKCSLNVSTVHKVGLFTARFLRPQLYQIIDYDYAKLSSSFTAESDDIPSLASAMPSRSYSTSMPSTVVAAMPSFSYGCAKYCSCGYAMPSFSYGHAK